MGAELSIILGLSVLSFIFFDLWLNTRGNQAGLSLGFFGLGLFFINLLTYTLYGIVNNDSTLAYLTWLNIVVTVVMWSSIFISIYIMLGTLWIGFKNFVNFFSHKFIGRKVFE